MFAARNDGNDPPPGRPDNKLINTDADTMDRQTNGWRKEIV